VIRAALSRGRPAVGTGLVVLNHAKHRQVKGPPRAVKRRQLTRPLAPVTVEGNPPVEPGPSYAAFTRIRKLRCEHRDAV